MTDINPSADAAGLSRARAVAHMFGSDFLDRCGTAMTRNFARHASLAADLTALEVQRAFMRAYHSSHLQAGQIARADCALYQPASPLNFAGLTSGMLAFALGMLGCGPGLRLLAWLLGRPGRPKAA